MNMRRALYMQSIRGPVLLITVGVLFAIHQAGVLSFSRTWPLLVIVIGVMKLLERAFAPAAPWPNAPQHAPAYPYDPTGRPAAAYPPYTAQQHTAQQPQQPPQNPPPAESGGAQQ